MTKTNRIGKIIAIGLIVIGGIQLTVLLPSAIEFIGSAYRQSFQQNQPTQED